MGTYPPEEYKAVLDEEEKYRQLKADIQKKTRKAYAARGSEEAKNELVAQACASIIEKLTTAQEK